MASWLRLKQLRNDRRAATALEYGIIGGVLALVFGLAFLQAAPHLAEIIAAAFRRMRG